MAGEEGSADGERGQSVDSASEDETGGQELGEVHAQNRRQFLKSGLGIGAGAAIGLGAGGSVGAALLAGTAVATPGGGGGGSTSSSVITKPTSSNYTQNKILPQDTTAIPLQVKRYTGSLQNLLTILNESDLKTFWIDPSGFLSLYNQQATHYDSSLSRTYLRTFLRENPGGQLEAAVDYQDSGQPVATAKAPIHAYDVRLANATVRTEDASGFREFYFRDSQFGSTFDPQGRLGWLIYDRHEPQQICHIEHFMGGGLPTGWKESGAGSGAGTSTPVDMRGGVRQVTTASAVNDRRVLDGQTNQWRFQDEMHAEFYLAGLSSTSNVIVYLGFADGELLDVSQPPANMVMFSYNSTDNANWRVSTRTNGVWGYYVVSTYPATTGSRFFRFEGWPAGQTAVDSTANVIIPYIDGNKVGASPWLKDNASGGYPIPWTTLMRPFFFVQTLDSTAKSLYVDAFKGFANETWR